MGFPAPSLSRSVGIPTVSIPSRGLWVFPRELKDFDDDNDFFVSIPSRGLWVFPPE